MKPVTPWPQPTYMPRVNVVVTRIAALELMTFIDMDAPRGGKLKAKLTYAPPSSPRPAYRPEWVRVVSFGLSVEPWNGMGGHYAMSQDTVAKFAKHDPSYCYPPNTKEGVYSPDAK